MKKLIVLIGFVALISVLNINVSPAYAQSQDEAVHLIVSPELSGLVSMWITEYSKENPDAQIKSSDIKDEAGINELKKEGTLGLVTEEYLRSLDGSSLWTMVVARDVIVPVISSKNPFSEQISTKGISPGQFSGIYTEPGLLTWGKVLATGDNTAINCYCLDDESLKFSLSQFLQAENLRSNIKNVNSNSELIEYIRNDKYAIGFCRLSGIIDYEEHGVREGLQIVPVDINGNGTLEHNENIYSCLNDFNRGVWIGKYPGSLCRNIHIVSSEAPVDVKEKGFISWILSGGQAYISEAGFSELIPGERQPKIEALNAADMLVVDSKKQPVKAATILFIAATVLLAAFLIFLVVKLVKASAKEPATVFSKGASVFNEESLVAPAGLFYDKTHTWVFMEKDGRVKVGIDDFLQHVTGKVTKIKMIDPGLKVKKGETLISLVQDGKQLDICSPVSGRIAETNHELAFNASMLNNSPYAEGWIYNIEPDNWLKETRKYFMADNYRQWLKTEFTRLKDFIAGAVKLNDLNYSHVVLQDGGEIKDRLMENFGPDVWEEFQRGFIDPVV
ncbi:MAG: hypothetical protein RQ743_05275 [Bacteroidales bacterium]|nr:hypothetical protein [Bacteroidales bacterium]